MLGLGDCAGGGEAGGVRSVRGVAAVAWTAVFMYSTAYNIMHEGLGWEFINRLCV